MEENRIRDGYKKGLCNYKEIDDYDNGCAAVILFDCMTYCSCCGCHPCCDSGCRTAGTT